MRGLTKEQYYQWKQDNAKYLVKTNMEYKDSTSNRTLGDVDIFFYPMKQDLPIIAVEHKRNNTQSSRIKAHCQLERFVTYLRRVSGYNHEVRTVFAYYRNQRDELLDFSTCEDWSVMSNEGDVMFL